MASADLKGLTSDAPACYVNGSPVSSMFDIDDHLWAAPALESHFEAERKRLKSTKPLTPSAASPSAHALRTVPASRPPLHEALALGDISALDEKEVVAEGFFDNARTVHKCQQHAIAAAAATGNLTSRSPPLSPRAKPPLNPRVPSVSSQRSNFSIEPQPLAASPSRSPRSPQSISTSASVDPESNTSPRNRTLLSGRAARGRHMRSNRFSFKFNLSKTERSCGHLETKESFV